MGIRLVACLDRVEGYAGFCPVKDSPAMSKIFDMGIGFTLESSVSNIFDMENLMSRLTFQEKMLWAQLLGIVVVVAFYGHFLVHSGPGHHYFHAVLLVLLLIFGSVRMIARRRSGNVVEDERDRTIAGIGARWSNIILWVGLVFILVLYWDNGTLRSANFLIGILFHLLVLAGSVRIIRELVAYRMTV